MSAAKNLRPRSLNKADRRQNRLEIRKSDGLKSYIQVNSTHQIEVRTYDLNPFGACIVVSPNEVSEINNSEHIELKIELAKDTKVQIIGKVRWKTVTIEKGLRVGLQFVEQVFPFASMKPLATNDFPVKLPHYFSVTGAFYKPFLFFERAMFKVNSISEKIWTIQLFDSEIILFKGLKLDLWLLSASDHSKPIQGEILDFQKGDRQSIICQIKVDGLSRGTKEWIARQLIYVCDFSPVEIKRIGLEAIKISNGFRFRFAKTEEEYEEVLRLRFKAYKEAGKVDSTKTFKDMMAPLDHLSRILIAKHGDKIVASVSISFPNDPQMMLDTEKAFPGGYPNPVPPKTEIVEISRLCTDSDYRRTDLLNRIFEYTYKVTLCGDRNYILTSTDKKLWPLYKKLGFKKTGMSYAHPYLSGIEHHVIIGKRSQPDYATNISPLSWNYLWRDMNSFMERKGFVNKSFVQKSWTFVISLLGKILKINHNREY